MLQFAVIPFKKSVVNNKWLKQFYKKLFLHAEEKEKESSNRSTNLTGTDFILV